MPGSVVSISREGTYVLLEAVLPGRAPRTAGVILLDPATGRGWARMRTGWSEFADPEDAEVLDNLGSHIALCMAEEGAGNFLASLEDTLSNVLRVSERQMVAVDSFTRVLDQLYGEHVEPATVEPFQTHVPLFSLRAAAGHLGEEMNPEAEDWIRLPEGARPSPDLFVAHVVGRSMEPRIPDGSLNLFRLHPAGSRQNKILLIQRRGVLDESARFTVKRYTSVKSCNEDGEWRHEQIRLEPLNPEFQPWDVGPEDFDVVAEWLRVIE
jgi:SOS-response transcriptional repressor LexA